MLSRIENTLHEKKQVFEKGYSTSDHLQALNQITEKSNECNLLLCIGFVDYENVFHTVEHFAIFEALIKTKINETCRNSTKHLLYSQATARIHLDYLVSNKFPINRRVKQGNPLSSKLFTAVMEEKNCNYLSGTSLVRYGLKKKKKKSRHGLFDAGGQPTDLMGSCYELKIEPVSIGYRAYLWTITRLY